ncbi:MAG: tripartite tricarboxylate transporter substrate-binding protein [Alphaproteobacteria bacterium]
MRHSYSILTIGALMAGAVAFSSPATAATGADYYNGKTVTWIVATGTGGGHDYYARLFARHMEKALPGSTFVVKNRPGAGHVIGANLINAAKPNGLTIGSFTTGLIYAQIQKLRGIRFDLSKMSWIGKGASDVRVISVAHNSEYQTWQDVLNTKRKLKFSASGVGSGSYNDSFLIGEAFGFPYRIIVGYQGPESALGMLRGETDALVGGLSSGMNYVRAGQTKIILQFGNLMKGVPNAIDQAKTDQQKILGRMLTLYGKLSRIVTGPPNIIPDRLAALRAAYVTAATSKAAIAEAKKSFRVIDHADGKQTTNLVNAMLNQPPQILDMLTALNKAKASVPMVKHTGPVSQIKRGGRRVWIMYQGKEVKTKISGSRTKVTINGKKAKRKKIKVGMTCTFTYPKPGAESKSVACKK